MIRNYKCLNKQIFALNRYSIVPIRHKDRYEIMLWRNEQIYHLRQSKPLTAEDQNHYFDTTIKALFEQEQPNQILFSYLEDDICIGYGGLVHLNWIDKNAELSFIMNSKLEALHFEFHWMNYLKLIEQVAFNQLNLHKIYTYAFDVRPHLYPIFEKSGFFQDARLKEHCFFNNKYLDVIIHSKINKTNE
jgi:RimJ/RimL family protein N-acetyltransferase